MGQIESMTPNLQSSRPKGPVRSRTPRLSIAVDLAEISPARRAAPPAHPKRAQRKSTELRVARTSSQATAAGSARAVSAPRPAPSAGASSAKEDKARSSNTRLALLISGFVLLAVNLIGSSYYLLQMGERVRHPLHPWLKSSGYIGQTAGILAFAMFLVLYTYPLRRRFRVLAFTGPLNRWLDVHIVLGLLIPFFGAVHASWRFKGLIGLGYLAMLLVSFSGVVGRYLYTRIPRGRSGLELTRDEIERRRKELLQQVVSVTGIDVAQLESALQPRTEARGAGIGATVSALIANDFARWRLSRRLRREWRKAVAGRGDSRALREVLRLARKEVALSQQARMLDATQRVLRLWHVAHRPFAATAFAAVVIHVVVVVMLGVTWFW
jgi:hypothetical protein